MALRLVQVTRRFGGRTALDAVSLHVRPGDCYGFLGHNGAGKTTSMRIALGLERADAGQVLVDGFDAAQFPREARARMGGLIETPGFHGHLGGAANLVLLARLQGLGRIAAKREAARLVEAVGLASAGTKPVRDYSQGMRQRLGIAQALIGSPKIVLLDEPMNGLDPEGIEETRRLLVRLTREEGTTVLLSSHQLAEIAGVCNRIGILRQGRMLVEEETAKLLAAEQGRYTLATADDAEAARILAAAGIAAAPHEAGLDVTLGARRPGDVARELVGRGVELRTWAPRPPSLEEIYLRFTQGGEARAVALPDASVRAAPAERRAPSRPVLRAAAYELRRWTSSATVPVLLALPAALAVGAVWRRAALLAGDVKEVGSARLASASDVTAFEGVARALQAAVPLVLVVLAGLASQSLAGEMARGTLRNVLLRPLTRLDAALGKALALAIVALASFAVAGAAAVLAASWWFDFKDVAEILPNGVAFPLPGGEASRVGPEMLRASALLLPVLLAFAGIGLLAGAVTRTGAGALAAALGAIAFLELQRAPGEVLGFEGWLPTSHAPWAGFRDRDTSAVQAFLETSQAMANRHDPFAGLHVVVPLVWAAVTLAAAAWVLRRRSIR